MWPFCFDILLISLEKKCNMDIYSYDNLIFKIWMKISVVCGSRAKDTTLLLKFFQMLNKQTFTDFDVNIVCDRNFTKDEESEFLSFFKNQNLEIINRQIFLQIITVILTQIIVDELVMYVIFDLNKRKGSLSNFLMMIMK